MNSLYTLALRQSSSLSSDLQHLASLSAQHQAPPASSPIHARIQSTLAELQQTVDDYDHMARREIVLQIRERATGRVERFRKDLEQYNQEYKRVQKSAADRSELLASTSSSSSISATTSSSPAVQQRSSTRYTPNSPWVPSPSAYPTTTTTNSPQLQQQSTSYGYDPRTNAALSEHDFLSSTSHTLDAYLAQGQAVLSNLASQRDVLKGTRRRLRTAANTLGLSRSTIAFVERRTKEDWYILLGGGVVTLLCFYMILKYLG